MRKLFERNHVMKRKDIIRFLDKYIVDIFDYSKEKSQINE
jgi:hypothetical protein